MSSRRLSAALGPLIALVLIGGVIAAVMGGSDDADTDFAAEPTEDPAFAESPSPEPTATATGGVAASPSETTTAQATETAAPIASEEATPAPAVPGPTETGTPPPATPQPAPTSDPDDIGSQPAVDDGALTGGWVGGTPNTGTAISAAGLVLLAIGGGLLWLRRSRA